ncbi:MAG: hypothetical protein AVDCRST_MAG66-2242, partial [uncultured Pseudonocardia sp.]
MGCWLVCDSTGQARVLGGVEIGTQAAIGRGGGQELIPQRMSGVERIDYIHIHPFPGYEAAGLSEGDLGAAQTLHSRMARLGVPARVGMTSIDTLTGTVTRGEPNPANGRWSRLQALPGGAGPVTDLVAIQPYLINTTGSFIENPLPLDIAPPGTSEALTEMVGAQVQPKPEELAAQRRHVEELADFDARLTMGGPGAPRPGAAPGPSLPEGPGAVLDYGWEGVWPRAGTLGEPTIVVRPDTPLDQIPPDPGRIGLLDHLRGDGAPALDALRNSRYRITGDEDWYRAVGDTAEQLRQLVIGTPPVSPERAAELFPTAAETPTPEPVPSSGQAPPDGYDSTNAAARRLLADGGPSGFTSPEMGCWLVCDSTGWARVLPEIGVGNDRTLGPGWDAGLTEDVLRDASRIELAHTHPLADLESAGLSMGDHRAAQALQQRLTTLGSPARLGITSISTDTGTVVRGVPDPVRGGWAQLQVLPGGAGPATDAVGVGPYMTATDARPILRPLPLDIEPSGTSSERTRLKRSIVQPTPEELAAQRRHVAELADFDARLAASGPDAPRPGTGISLDAPRPRVGIPAQLREAPETAEADERRETEGPDAPGPGTDVSNVQDSSGQSQDSAGQSAVPSPGHGGGVVVAPELPGWDPTLDPNAAHRIPRPAPQVSTRPTPPEWYTPEPLRGFGEGPQPEVPTTTAAPREDTSGLEMPTTRFPPGLEEIPTDEPARD